MRSSKLHNFLRVDFLQFQPLVHGEQEEDDAGMRRIEAEVRRHEEDMRRFEEMRKAEELRRAEEMRRVEEMRRDEEMENHRLSRNGFNAKKDEERKIEVIVALKQIHCGLSELNACNSVKKQGRIHGRQMRPPRYLLTRPFPYGPPPSSPPTLLPSSLPITSLHHSR